MIRVRTSANDAATLQSADVCVIGSGAGGSIAAAELVRSGLRVLVLEQGRAYRAGDSLQAAERGWPSAYVHGTDGALTYVGRPWSGCSLGGGMPFFAGIAFRLRHVDFDASAHVAADALDPAWPIGYQDLMPWYDKVERLIGIARTAGADPTDPESAPPVMPPHPFSVPGQVFAAAGRRLGLQPFPTPLAINSTAYRGRPACHRCGPCNEYVCPSGAKADAAAILLSPLAAAGALTLSTSSRALRLVFARTHRAAEVEWLDRAARLRRTTKVRAVVLAANAVQSAALLLRSGYRAGDGPRDSPEGMVGRALSFKVSSYVTGEILQPDSARVTGGPFSTVTFTDYYLDQAAPTMLGGLIYEASQHDWNSAAGRTRLRLHCLAADQPMLRNRVLLSGNTDADGVPQLVIDYQTHRTDTARLEYLGRKARQILRAAGASNIAECESGYALGSRHLHGTCRAGSDPRTSVVDRWGRVHDSDNVFVVDGGFFPYPGGVNPTFTIQANAWRISAEIARRLGAGGRTGHRPATGPRTLEVPGDNCKD
jgi:choline dehydrogenase-like flavoprotein